MLTVAGSRVGRNSIGGATLAQAQVASVSERRNAGLGPAEDQGVDVVGAFVGIDHLQVLPQSGTKTRPTAVNPGFDQNLIRCRLAVFW